MIGTLSGPMKPRSRLVRVVRCLLAVGAGMVGVSAAVATTASATDMNTHQFNLYGWKGNAGGLPPATEVKNRVNASSPTYPFVITLNEVCSNQYDAINADLVSKGYTGFPSPSILFFGQPNCSWFGNALFVLGARQTDFIFTYSAQKVDPNNENRNLVCAAMTSFLTDFFACATHLESDDLSYSQPQADEAIYLFNSNYPSYRKELGGDLNMNSLNSHLAGFYSQHSEADEQLYKRSTTDGGVAIDYSFASKANLSRWQMASIDSVSSSDHHYYRGWFRF